MVEVLLALTIGGLVLVAATALLITISQAWANRPATRDAFDAHVNGVAHFSQPCSMMRVCQHSLVEGVRGNYCTS